MLRNTCTVKVLGFSQNLEIVFAKANNYQNIHYSGILGNATINYERLTKTPEYLNYSIKIVKLVCV